MQTRMSRQTWASLAISAAIHGSAFATLGLAVDRAVPAKTAGPLQITWLMPAPPAPAATPAPVKPQRVARPASRSASHPIPRPVIASAGQPSDPTPAIPAAPAPAATPPASDHDMPPSEASANESAAPAPPVVPPLFTAAYLRNPPPDYPAESRRWGEEGRVLLRVRVRPDGQPDEILLQQSSGHRRLDRAALDAVRRWRFAPARQGEQAVAAWVVVPLHFSLHEAA